MEYNKLVRDKIPQIIEAKGGTCRTVVLSEAEYIQKLEEKLSEELSEYLESRELEELVDLLEVMEALVKARGETWEELQRIKNAKSEVRGGFEDRILLLESQK